MPEGDTIHYAANRIRPLLLGDIPDAIETPHPRHQRDSWPERLAGRTVEAVDAADPKVPKVKIKAGKLISHPVTLAEIKTSELFEGSALVRQGRLSVVPLNKEQYEWLTGR